MDKQDKLINSIEHKSDRSRVWLDKGYPVTIRTYRQKDILHIIKRHMDLYEKENGFNSKFGDYVKENVLKFDRDHDKNKENIWVAEIDGVIVGCIAIVKVNDSTAQLRWFLIEPQWRGMGLGHKLIQTAISFCKNKNYTHVFLWTVNILKTARHLYESYGFSLTETIKSNEWGKELFEERWDLYF